MPLTVKQADSQVVTLADITLTGGSRVPLHAVTTSAGVAIDPATQAGQDTINANVGAQADAAATTDTGPASLLALLKRGLQNWTSLLARMPALGAATMSGSVPVAIATDHLPVQTQRVFAATLTLLSGAATPTTGTGMDWAGGPGLWIVYGTFGGATVTLQMSPDGGTTWLDTNAVTTSADGIQTSIPAAKVRTVVSGGSGASISCKLMGI